MDRKETLGTRSYIAIAIGLFLLCLTSYRVSAQDPDRQHKESVGHRFEIQKLAPRLINGKRAHPIVDAYICNEVERPRAVLVVCTNSAGLLILEKFTKGPEWLEFAKNHQLGFVVLTVAQDRRADQTSRGYRADGGMGEWLLSWIDHYYGKDVPVLLYGASRGGTFATSLVHWRPERIAAWAAYTNQWFEKPTKTKLMIPGMVAYDSEDQVSAKEFGGRWYFQAARKQGKPLLEVSVTAPLRSRRDEMANFARKFFASILSEEHRTSSLWIALRNMKRATTERSSTPEQVVWLPSENIQSDWESLTTARNIDPEDERPIIIERTVTTNNPLQPELRLFLRLPPKKGLQELTGVLAFCSWEGKAEEILKKLQPDAFERFEKGHAAALKDLVAQLIAFADKHKLAVLTWETAQVWSLKPSYYPEKEEEDRTADFDSMAVAWDQGVDALIKEAGLPESGYLLFGISRGAQWAHRLALRRPERFVAVQFHVSSTFDVPTPAASRLLWLVSTGDREVGYRTGDASRFYEQSRELNYPVLFKVARGLGHDDNLEIRQLREGFFTYALHVRDRMIEEGFEKPSDIALGELNAAPWVGDYKTYKVVPSDAADQIPERNRVPLPTEEFVRAWSGRPAPKSSR